ncbi:dihydropyrimidinase, partial [Archaeoglobales archaeon]
KDGRVVLPGGVVEANIAIEGGKIVGIGKGDIFPKAETVLNARNKIVIPGGIDAHTHFETPFMGALPEETWELGTKAAATGGTTCVVNFSIQKQGKKLKEAIDADIERASKLSIIDFALHGCFTDIANMDSVISEIKPLIEMGVLSFKEFLIYKKEGWMIDDWGLFKILKEVGEYGGIVGVHAENAPIGEGFQEELTNEGKTESKYHPISKPNFVEAEAIQRASSIATFANAPLYIVHMSTKEGVEIVRRFRDGGAKIFAETCTHYLCFTEEVHERDFKSLISPPLRKEEDILALWEGLSKGIVSIVASDHAPFNSGDKEKGFRNRGFITVPNGAPGVLERIPMIFYEGVVKGRITLQKMVEVTSTNVAKLLGLYPKKGVIAPGSDADLVIIDPDKEVTLGCGLYDAIDWSLYEGMKIKGFPSEVLSKGEIVVEDGEFYGKPGHGEFIKRENLMLDEL